jgi:DNA replication and repair protein RecF
MDDASVPVGMADAAQPSAADGSLWGPAASSPIWVERLQLTDFRNYASLSLRVGPAPVVLTGANGAGKTNLLEALSLLTSGQGLRRAPYPELTRMSRPNWTVAARLVTPLGAVDIGTGLSTDADIPRRTGRTDGGRIVRIDGETKSGSGALADHVEMLWLTPAMDGLFTGPASDRRRFLDRLISGLDPNYRSLLGQFERAMQQRNRLLADDVREASRFEGFERIMAEAGVAVAAARGMAVARLAAAIAARRDAARGSAFPWAELLLVGTLETGLATRAAVDVEDDYARLLAGGRERDRAAGRTLEGPHRSDLIVGHGPSKMPARVCSTGEQKALLIGLVLAHCDLARQRRQGPAPMLLLDEIAAHLDPARRLALFDEIAALGSQTWMTGTDPEAFSALVARAQFWRVDEGRVAPCA